MEKKTRTIAPEVAPANMLDAANDKGSLGEVLMTSGKMPSIDSVSYSYSELAKHGIAEVFFSYDDGGKYNLIAYT